MITNRADNFLRIIRHSDRGKLKIYLGYCAGVGKTYQMLQEARRLKENGIDIVVGFVETHGREETEALLEGLEIIPRKKLDYRGIVIEEMDLDAVLMRKPVVVLVDELAHTNIPGIGNSKRYQDIEDILNAGIHVISTLNVQHLESLYGTVERVTGVKMRERVPDRIVMDADQVVNIDVSIEDLRQRICEGKVYIHEHIEIALENFFRSSNLQQLRELTLRELAAQIDLRQRDTLDEQIPSAPDQVMVCLSSRGPNSETLLRYASRLAGRLNRNWYALYVQTPFEDPTVIDAETQRILSGTLTLAKQLGSMVFTYKGENIPDTIIRFAREYRVGHIVIGNSLPLSRWQQIKGKKTVVEYLLENADGITVVVLDTRVQNSRYPYDRELPPSPHRKSNEPSPSLPTLTNVLSPGNIIIWDESVLKEEVLNALTRAALGKQYSDLLSEVSRKLWEREEIGSTFFNEGVAFPHARLDGINHPLLALGLTRQGIVDVNTEHPVEIVFLILSPAKSPTDQLQMLALTSKAAQSRYLIQNLKSVSDANDAMKAINNWERLK